MGMSGSALVEPKDLGEIIELKHKQAESVYIHSEAEALAGYDIPIFIDGDLNQMNLPVEEQDILLLLPDGEHKCKATIEDDLIRPAYYITLFDEKM